MSEKIITTKILVNNILKDEFYLHSKPFSYNIARKSVKNVIKIYNNERLHLSLSYKI